MKRSLPILAAVLSLAPSVSHAFCGFYVSGAGAEMYNNATVVVLMRDGTRTVLSMQNNYQGPPGDFAMVVPVPVVVQKDNVKTLPQDVFKRVDQMASPRLVEYWERDPCNIAMPKSNSRIYEFGSDKIDGSMVKPDGVTVEARFEVGEYQVVVLSAQDSSGLETWLRREKYQIPAQAERLLRPYVVSGMKFFVARVNTKKVRFQNGRAVLSPLRVHFDSEQFNLPIRLGLVNSSGVQDLLVHILAPAQRYEVANYNNLTIPTNLVVKEQTKASFAAFYNSLFDDTLRRYGPGVVTEYAWNASTCDPCPGATLSTSDFQTLGADVLENRGGSGFVLTRLHARYGPDVVGDDLVFRKAEPITGGRGTPDRDGKMIRGVRKEGANNFQGRYAILHRWEGAVACQAPMRGQWGGPPNGGNTLQAATDLAFAKRAPDAKAYLETQLAGDDVELSQSDGTRFVGPTGEAPPLEPIPSTAPPVQKPRSGCAGCRNGQASWTATFLFGCVLLLLARPSRRRKS